MESAWIESVKVCDKMIPEELFQVCENGCCWFIGWHSRVS